MAHLKHIKRRLNSVRTTQKMVTAMKLVAGARFRQAHGPLQHASCYEEGMRAVLGRVASETESHHESAWYFDGLKKPEAVEAPSSLKHLVLVITSDRGLCGAFHQQVSRAAVQHAQSLGGDAVDFVYWGSKGRSYIQRFFPHQTVSWQDQVTLAQPGETEAQRLERLIFDAFQKHTYQRVWILYGKFFSGLSQKPSVHQCLPLKMDGLTQGGGHHHDTSGALYEFEPGVEKMAEALVRRYVRALIYRLMCESSLAENAARMMAMDSASRNAQKLSQKLALEYNRTRQALVTKELIEIIVGAETLAS